MITDGRYALLLRPQIAGDLTARAIPTRLRNARRRNGAGSHRRSRLAARTTSTIFRTRNGDDEVHEAVVRVDSLYMDRYPVTNEQYQSFVDAGGYEQSSIWHPEILPAVLDFVDKTGIPGPRYWENGRYPPGKAKHPGRRRLVVRSLRLRSLGRQAPADRRRMGQGRQLAGVAGHTSRAGNAASRGASRWTASAPTSGRSSCGWHRGGRRVPRRRQRRRRVSAHRQRLGMDAGRFRCRACRRARGRARIKGR